MQTLFDKSFRVLSSLLVSLLFPLILPYSIPVYWINVLMIFSLSMVIHWFIDFARWTYKKAKAHFLSV